MQCALATRQLYGLLHWPVRQGYELTPRPIQYEKRIAVLGNLKKSYGSVYSASHPQNSALHQNPDKDGDE